MHTGGSDGFLCSDWARLRSSKVCWGCFVSGGESSGEHGPLGSVPSEADFRPLVAVAVGVGCGCAIAGGIQLHQHVPIQRRSPVQELASSGWVQGVTDVTP